MLLLASASPRRQELIPLLGIPWDIRAAAVDEDSVDHPDPAVNVVETALLKGTAVAPLAPRGAVVVAADTTVALNGQMLNKPAGAAEAKKMLRSLRGRIHQVHTGIAVIAGQENQVLTDVATTDVPMRLYSDEEIEAYIATGDPMDKAGAYAIQHPEFRPVASMSGCYAAVMGLPLCHLVRNLSHLGIESPVDIAAACQAFLNYDCPVFAEILAYGVSGENLAK